jgi:hypothetical protein
MWKPRSRFRSGVSGLGLELETQDARHETRSQRVDESRMSCGIRFKIVLGIRMPLAAFLDAEFCRDVAGNDSDGEKK